jgi:hypothetical protein
MRPEKRPLPEVSSGLILWKWGSANRDVVRLTEVFRIDVENSQIIKRRTKDKRSKFIFSGTISA